VTGSTSIEFSRGRKKAEREKPDKCLLIKPCRGHRLYVPNTMNSSGRMEKIIAAAFHEIRD